MTAPREAGVAKTPFQLPLYGSGVVERHTGNLPGGGSANSSSSTAPAPLQYREVSGIGIQKLHPEQMAECGRASALASRMKVKQCWGSLRPIAPTHPPPTPPRHASPRQTTHIRTKSV